MKLTNWILIECEMNRMVRTNYFNLSRNNCLINFNKREEQVKWLSELFLLENVYKFIFIHQILYGYCNHQNSMKSFLHQSSPLMAEIFFMAPEDQTIFKIGEETYQGFSPYIIEFEKYYTKSETELYSFKIHIGILGHPKCFYNTMFHLDPHVVKKRQNTKNDDQYGFAEKFTLKIHKNHNFWLIYPYII